uniref:Putative nuclear pore complex protein n=1 Tax=Culex tarsalis TaxID=7177 RepID=A0A1Q3FMS1_CULTA
MSALYFPAELSLADTNCVICQDDAKNPVFCTTCKKMLCYTCIMRCESSAGCPTCRGQIERNALRDQCKLYSCEVHDQLVTMLCTDCEVCVCKQCLGKDADHAKHSFVSIDSIRAEMAQAMDKLYEYMELVDGFTGLGTMKNINGELAEKYFTFSNVLQANIDKIKSTVAEIEEHNLKNLIKNRKEIKALLQATVDELDQMNEPEPREIYELEVFPMELNPKPSGNFSNVYKTKINDNFGNRWKIHFLPKYRVICGTRSPNFCAFYLTLKSGIPGRYEVNIDAENPHIKFQKVLEFFNIASTSSTYVLTQYSGEDPFQALTVSIRPTNFKYHLQCSKLYQQLISKPTNNTFDVVFFKIKRFFEDHETSEPDLQNCRSNKVEKLFKDKTGTQWRISIEVNQSNSFKLQLEHYDGASGRYEFFVELVNPNDESLNVKYTACHRFAFGSTYCIRKFANLLFSTAASSRACQNIKVGIRPAPELTGTKRIREEAQRMLRKLAGNG